MITHMAVVLDIMAVKFPNHKPVRLLYWSSCHDCLEEGAGVPSVSTMNKGYGGVKTKLVEDTPKLKAGRVQHLTFQKGEVPFYAPDATDHNAS